ncbi:MAG TPA: zf-HC2 domain-containing protein [Candidatus Acidoferrales bacterium]|nr:zf-HC2 domain-containing protein [Candidatus Acidoferrales bacterium]
MTDTNTRMACLEYEALLEDYLEGVLDETSAETARQHLRGCAGCNEAFDRASGSVRLLRIAEPTTAPDTAFARNVMARIGLAEQERTAEHTRFWQPIVALGWRFAATATLAVGVLVSCDIGWSHYARLNVPSARSIEGNLFAPEPARPPANGDEVLMMVAETSHGKQ